MRIAIRRRCDFGCLERIEDKLEKKPVHTEPRECENNGNLAEALEPLVDSINRTSRNLRVLHDALKIISDRQKKYTEDLLTTVKQEIQSFRSHATVPHIVALLGSTFR